MLIDSLSNLLAILNRAIHQKQLTCTVGNTKIVRTTLSLLLSQGFIYSYAVNTSNPRRLTVFLKYNLDRPMLRTILRISKPGGRVYCSYKELYNFTKLYNLINANTSIFISTSLYGIITHTFALKNKVGGELLFVIN